MKSIFSKKPIFIIVLMVFISCSENVEVVHPEIEINFSVNNEIVYEGDEVSYTDESSGDPTNWEWTFNGGTPLSSNEQNPKVEYGTKGIYDVSLHASNANKSNVKSKSGFITVKSSFDRGLIGHYLLDGDAIDDTGNQTSGTIIENATLTQDRFDNTNSAYEFNTGNDRIDIKTNYSVNNSFSVFCWLKLNDLLTVQSHHIFNIDGNVGFLLRNPDGLRVVLDGENGNQISLQSNDYLIFEDLNWHLVGFTYDGFSLLLYIDGEQVKSLDGTVNISQISDLASIGNHNTAVRPLVGAIDDLRVYDRVVTADDILKLFNE